MAHFARLSIYGSATVFLVLNFVCSGFASTVIGHSIDCPEEANQYCQQNYGPTSSNRISDVQKCLDDAKKICKEEYPNSKEQRRRCRKEKKNNCKTSLKIVQENEFYQCCKNSMKICLESKEFGQRDGQNIFQNEVTVPMEFCYSVGDCHLVYVTYQTYTVV